MHEYTKASVVLYNCMCLDVMVARSTYNKVWLSYATQSLSP